MTHNGDFAAFAGFGGLVDVGASLGPWLEEALQNLAESMAAPRAELSQAELSRGLPLRRPPTSTPSPTG